MTQHPQYRSKKPNAVERRLHGYKGQWVPVPIVLVRHWRDLGLKKPDDLLLLIVLLSYKLDERLPYPSINTVAKAINKSQPTVFRRLDELEHAGFLTRKRRPNQSNEYDLSGLFEKIRQYEQYEGEPDETRVVEEKEPEQSQDTGEQHPLATAPAQPLTKDPARRAALKAQFGGAVIEPSVTDPSVTTNRRSRATPQEEADASMSTDGVRINRRLSILDGQPYDFSRFSQRFGMPSSPPTPPPPTRPPPPPPPRSKEERLRAQLDAIRDYFSITLRMEGLHSTLRQPTDEEILEVGLPLVPEHEDPTERANMSMVLTIDAALLQKLLAERPSPQRI